MVIKNDKPHLGDTLMILAMMQQLQREGKDVAYVGRDQTNELLYKFVPIARQGDGDIDVTDICGDWGDYTKAFNLDWNGTVANLGRQHDGDKIGVCCVSRDFRRCYPHEKALVSGLKRYGKVVVFGHDSLPYWKLIDEVASLKILISTNNGIAHLAGCLGVPLVIIEGPYDCREIYGWYGDVRYISSKIGCRPCNDKVCLQAHCLYLIHPKQIIQQAFELNEILVDTYTDNPNRGFGDIIMLTVIAKAFKQIYPDIPVTYVVRDATRPLINNNQYINKVVSECPVVTNKTNYIRVGYAFEDYSVLRNRRNRIDSMLIYSGISTNDKKPEVHFPRIPWNYRKKNKTNIGVGINSMSSTRRWPTAYLQKLAFDMPEYVFHVFDNQINGCKNIFSHNLNMINLMNAISQMDIILCVDSMISHIAGALNVPAITLYTNVKAEWRNKYYKNIGIQSPIPCSPCMECQFGVIEGCNTSIMTPCVLALSPELVRNRLSLCV